MYCNPFHIKNIIVIRDDDSEGSKYSESIDICIMNTRNIEEEQECCSKSKTTKFKASQFTECLQMKSLF